MRLTSKGRYAVRAMLDLTINSKGNPVRLQEISRRQAISLHYLEQLFRKLRTGQVVKSVRGPGGGYVLSRNMDEISIKDVLSSVGENINPARDISGAPSSGVDFQQNPGETGTVNTVEFKLTRGYFENLGTIMQEYLESTTLGDLMRNAENEKANTNTFADAQPAAATSVFGQAATETRNDNAATETTNTETISSIRSHIGDFS
jgi:Rrf2 family iron-sulfur cluster assembly transcriptional regulator